jgi:hypothetical protein
MSNEENKPEEQAEQTNETPEPISEEKKQAMEARLQAKLERAKKPNKWEQLGFKSPEGFALSKERFAQTILNGEQERLREQPSKSSAHNLALQQALGKLAEVVFHGREFLEVWGAECTPIDFVIQVVLEDKVGRRVNHGIQLTHLVASIEPCGEEYANDIEDVVLQSLRNISWTLACVTRYAAETHAKLEKELFKDTSEAEAEAKTSGDSNLGVG